MEKAKFYKKLKDNVLQCRLCSHFCVIKDKESGLCMARENNNGELFSLVYGYPVARNVDPVEKKPLFHFMPGSYTYSLGTLGCNLKCANCLNWSMSQAEGIKQKNSLLDYISPERVVEEAVSNDCRSISYTYNEPTIFAEYALDIMKIAHENNLKNIWVSNGFMSPECLEAVIPYLDAINVDLKSADDKFYRKICSARLEPVLNNLMKLKQEQVHLEITTLIIPSLSSDMEMIRKIAEFIADELDMDTPWHISRFSPEISWKLKDLSPTGDDAVYEAYEIGREAGLKYVYAGNMPGDDKENTYCPSCGELAIKRTNYQIERFDDHGVCAYCEKTLGIIE